MLSGGPFLLCVVAMSERLKPRRRALRATESACADWDRDDMTVSANSLQFSETHCEHCAHDYELALMCWATR